MKRIAKWKESETYYNWFRQKINKTHDTRFALTTEAAGAVSHLRHLLEWVLEAQAISGLRGPPHSNYFGL